MTLLTDSSPAPAGAARLRLAPIRYRHMTLDGRWWPRSGDPAVELAALVAALDDARTPVARLLLSVTGWSRRPHDVVVAGRTVSLGYCCDRPPALLTGIRSDGGLLTLLVAADAA